MSTRSIVASWRAQPEGISQPPCCQRAPAAEDRKRCVTWDTWLLWSPLPTYPSLCSVPSGWWKQMGVTSQGWRRHTVEELWVCARPPEGSPSLQSEALPSGPRIGDNIQRPAVDAWGVIQLFSKT